MIRGLNHATQNATKRTPILPSRLPGVGKVCVHWVCMPRDAANPFGSKLASTLVIYRAGEEIRTLDVNLGKVALYH